MLVQPTLTLTPAPNPHPTLTLTRCAAVLVQRAERLRRAKAEEAAIEAKKVLC